MTAGCALVDELRRCPPAAAEAILAELGARELEVLAWEWRGFWARRDQVGPPGGWTYWFLLGGRGSGKTRSAAEWVIERARAGLGPIRLIAGTADDVRDTMVEGDSGILACSPPDFRPVWEPSVGVAGRLTWPNGVVARCFTAEKPARLRGRQSQTDWYDDITNWGVRAQKTWDQSQWGLRIGDARAVLTASPEDAELLESLIEDGRRGMVTTESKTDDNVTNLAKNLFDNVLAQYEGTEQEQQERYGRYQKKNNKSPFHGIDFNVPPVRVVSPPREDLVEVIVAIDPSETARADSDECGIVVMGRCAKGHYYVLEDLSDCVEAEVWGPWAIEAAERWKASCFVAESNRGLQKTVTSVLNSAYLARRLALGAGAGVLLPVVGVVALVAKEIRASPVRQLYVKGLLHHVAGLFKLENQQRKWDPMAPKKPKQDDRLDAMVHGATFLAKLNEEPKKPPPRGAIRMPGIF